MDRASSVLFSTSMPLAMAPVLNSVLVIAATRSVQLPTASRALHQVIEKVYSVALAKDLRRKKGASTLRKIQGRLEGFESCLVSLLWWPRNFIMIATGEENIGASTGGSYSGDSTRAQETAAVFTTTSLLLLLLHSYLTHMFAPARSLFGADIQASPGDESYASNATGKMIRRKSKSTYCGNSKHKNNQG
jgi:hypothetical protein